MGTSWPLGPTRLWPQRAEWVRAPKDPRWQVGDQLLERGGGAEALPPTRWVVPGRLPPGRSGILSLRPARPSRPPHRPGGRLPRTWAWIARWKAPFLKGSRSPLSLRVPSG